MMLGDVVRECGVRECGVVGVSRLFSLMAGGQEVLEALRLLLGVLGEGGGVDLARGMGWLADWVVEEVPGTPG